MKKNDPDHPTPPQRPSRKRNAHRLHLVSVADALVTLVRRGHNEAAAKVIEGLNGPDAAFVAVSVYARLWPANGYRASFLQLLSRTAGS